MTKELPMRNGIHPVVLIFLEMHLLFLLLHHLLMFPDLIPATFYLLWIFSIFEVFNRDVGSIIEALCFHTTPINKFLSIVFLLIIYFFKHIIDNNYTQILFLNATIINIFESYI